MNESIHGRPVSMMLKFVSFLNTSKKYMPNVYAKR